MDASLVVFYRNISIHKSEKRATYKQFSREGPRKQYVPKINCCHTTEPPRASRAYLINRRPNVYSFSVFPVRIVADNVVVDAAILDGVVDNVGVHDEIFQADAFPTADAKIVPPTRSVPSACIIIADRAKKMNGKVTETEVCE